MLQFAANLTMLYSDTPFLERFDRARASGFQFVEYLFPYEFDISSIDQALTRNGLMQVLFNLPPGNWSAGDRGTAGLPDRVDEFRQGIAHGLEIARQLSVPQLNCLAGKWDARFSREEQERVLVKNLSYASDEAAKQGIGLLSEFLNPFDMPGYMLGNPAAALAIQERVASPNFKVLFDVYHAQRTAGELENTLQKNLDRIGHVQIADNPGRHQPGTGEINFRHLFGAMERMGYRGYIGLEYIPDGPTERSLAWMREYGFAD